MLVAHVPRAEELLVVLAVEQRRLVPIQSSCRRELTNQIIVKKQFKAFPLHLVVSKEKKTDLDMQVLGEEWEIGGKFPKRRLHKRCGELVGSIGEGGIFGGKG